MSQKMYYPQNIIKTKLGVSLDHSVEEKFEEKEKSMDFTRRDVGGVETLQEQRIPRYVMNEEDKVIDDRYRNWTDIN